MGQRAGYGVQFGGGDSGLSIFIPASASIPFADIPARNTWAAANTTDLLQGRTVVSVTGTPDTWYIWLGPDQPSVPNAADWSEYTDVVRGPEGQPGADSTVPGPAGVDGARRTFTSISDRDSFYDLSQANRDNLAVGTLIGVRVADGVEARQEWIGAPAPTSYGTNGPFNWRTVSLLTAGASIRFADLLRIFDFGALPAFEDMVNNVRAVPVGQQFTLAGGSQNARQISFGDESTLVNALPAVPPVNSALQTVHSYTFDTTGLITNPAIVLQGVINFVVAPNFYVVEIFLGTDATGTRVFNERFDPGGVAGNFVARADGLEERPSPQRFLPNTTYFFRLTGDIPFQYVQADGATNPAGASTGFEFTFEDLIGIAFFRNNAAGFGAGVAVTGSVTVNSGNQETYNRKFIYTATAEANPVTLTISPDLDFNGFVFYVFGTGTFTIAGGTGVTIDGESSREFSSGMGARLIQSPENQNDYRIGFSSDGVPGVIMQDEGVTVGEPATTINVVGPGASLTGAGPIKTLTISGTTSPLPQPGPTELRYGLSQQSDPALVDFGALTSIANPTDPQTISTGITAQGDYFHIYSVNTHDINTITDDVLQQTVYEDGDPRGDNVFTKQNDVRTESSVTFDSYTVGPLVTGANENYDIDFL